MDSLVPNSSDNGDAPTLPHLPCKVEDIGVSDAAYYCNMIDFWDSCRPWLALKGINLYDICRRDPEEACRSNAWLCPQTPTAGTTSLPYTVSLKDDDSASRFVKVMANRRIGYARDRMGRNVVLKLVDKGSAEHSINRRLLQETESLIPDNESFPYALSPVAVLDSPRQYSFVIMPTWGSPIYLEDLQSCREILQVMRCVLRGLAFLHDRRIAHRDICEHNIVVNVNIPGVGYSRYRELLRDYRQENEVIYALMDFDQSIQLPPDTSLVDCRRPSQEAIVGNGLYKPYDISRGEPFYNPFAFDVGMTGHFLQYHFAEAVTEVPGLAALFDRMTDHFTSRRLSARQALSFFDGIVSRIPHDVLKAPITLKPSFDPTNDPNLYWSKLSDADRSVWEKYRTPPQSLLRHILDWVVSYPLGWSVVSLFRRTLQF